MRSFMSGFSNILQRGSSQSSSSQAPVIRLDAANLSPFVELLETAVKQKLKHPSTALALVDNAETNTVVSNFAENSNTRTALELQETNTLWSALIQIVRTSDPILSDGICTTLSTANSHDVTHIASILPPHHRQMIGALLSASEIIVRVDSMSGGVVIDSITSALMRNLPPTTLMPDEAIGSRGRAFVNLTSNQRLDFPFCITFARGVGLEVTPMASNDWTKIVLTLAATTSTSISSSRQAADMPVSDRVELLEDATSPATATAVTISSSSPSQQQEQQLRGSLTRRTPSMNPDEFSFQSSPGSISGGGPAIVGGLTRKKSFKLNLSAAIEEAAGGQAAADDKLVVHTHDRPVGAGDSLAAIFRGLDAEKEAPAPSSSSNYHNQKNGQGLSSSQVQQPQPRSASSSTSLIRLKEAQELFSLALISTSTLENRLKGVRGADYDEDYADLSIMTKNLPRFSSSLATIVDIQDRLISSSGRNTIAGQGLISWQDYLQLLLPRLTEDDRELLKMRRVTVNTLLSSYNDNSGSKVNDKDEMDEHEHDQHSFDYYDAVETISLPMSPPPEKPMKRQQQLTTTARRLDDAKVLPPAKPQRYHHQYHSKDDDEEEDEVMFIPSLDDDHHDNDDQPVTPFAPPKQQQQQQLVTAFAMTTADHKQQQPKQQQPLSSLDRKDSGSAKWLAAAEDDDDDDEFGVATTATAPFIATNKTLSAPSSSTFVAASSTKSEEKGGGQEDKGWSTAAVLTNNRRNNAYDDDHKNAYERDIKQPISLTLSSSLSLQDSWDRDDHQPFLPPPLITTTTIATTTTNAGQPPIKINKGEEGVAVMSSNVEEEEEELPAPAVKQWRKRDWPASSSSSSNNLDDNKSGHEPMLPTNQDTKAATGGGGGMMMMAKERQYNNEQRNQPHNSQPNSTNLQSNQPLSHSNEMMMMMTHFNSHAPPPPTSAASAAAIPSLGSADSVAFTAMDSDNEPPHKQPVKATKSLSTAISRFIGGGGSKQPKQQPLLLSGRESPSLLPATQDNDQQPLSSQQYRSSSPSLATAASVKTDGRSRSSGGGGKGLMTMVRGALRMPSSKDKDKANNNSRSSSPAPTASDNNSVNGPVTQHAGDESDTDTNRSSLVSSSFQPLQQSQPRLQPQPSTTTNDGIASRQRMTIPPTASSGNKQLQSQQQQQAGRETHIPRDDTAIARQSVQQLLLDHDLMMQDDDDDDRSEFDDEKADDDGKAPTLTVNIKAATARPLSLPASASANRNRTIVKGSGNNFTAVNETAAAAAVSRSQPSLSSLPRPPSQRLLKQQQPSSSSSSFMRSRSGRDIDIIYPTNGTGLAARLRQQQSSSPQQQQQQLSRTSINRSPDKDSGDSNSMALAQLIQRSQRLTDRSQQILSHQPLPLSFNSNAPDAKKSLVAELHETAAAMDQKQREERPLQQQQQQQQRSMAALIDAMQDLLQRQEPRSLILSESQLQSMTQLAQTCRDQPRSLLLEEPQLHLDHTSEVMIALRDHLQTFQMSSTVSDLMKLRDPGFGRRHFRPRMSLPVITGRGDQKKDIFFSDLDDALGILWSASLERKTRRGYRRRYFAVMLQPECNPNLAANAIANFTLAIPRYELVEYVKAANSIWGTVGLGFKRRYPLTALTRITSDPSPSKHGREFTLYFVMEGGGFVYDELEEEENEDEGAGSAVIEESGPPPENDQEDEQKGEEKTAAAEDNKHDGSLIAVAASAEPVFTSGVSSSETAATAQQPQPQLLPRPAAMQRLGSVGAKSVSSASGLVLRAPHGNDRLQWIQVIQQACGGNIPTNIVAY